ncbi:MAG: signal peptidase II [Coriobacteriia bacterium]|nr:signal peptidase II [Coriobacteriia bacterium]
MSADKDFENGRTVRAVARRFAVFIPIVVVWLVLDQASKLFFNGSYHAGQVISDPILGIFRFHLVYNTGGAWSIFSGATRALGAFSLVVCIALTAYLVLTPQRPNAGELIGISLVVAGGIGNAIDRFTLGFVVDFIEPTFIDFPIFNVADIGVTCGIILFIVSLFIHQRTEAKNAVCGSENGGGE